tara:strand:- start:465 stop:1745 length:1281 start_codon:yes stop_codon:yes gene_type:complete
MGLGVALTAFLTGFSKQAKAEIETRNAELRENMDKQIEEHEKKYQLEYDLKKEQRKRLKERSAVLDVELESLADIAGPLDLTYGQRLVLAKDDATLLQFQQDIRDIKLMDSVEGQRLQLEAIKGRISGKNNIKYDSMDQAIDAATELDAIAAPVAVSQKTAFGLPTTAGKRQLEEYKARKPDAFKERKTRDPIAGTYTPRPGATKFTQAQAKTAVADIVGSQISNRMSEIGNFVLIRDPYNDQFSFKNKAGDITTPSSTKARAALQNAYQASVIGILDTYMNKQDSTIPTELAMAINNANLGLDFEGRLGSGADRVYVGDILEKFMEDAPPPASGASGASGANLIGNQKQGKPAPKAFAKAATEWNAKNQDKGKEILALGDKANSIDQNDPDADKKVQEIFKQIQAIYPAIENIQQLQQFIQVIRP